MSEQFPQIRVAVVQAAPILFDREATVEKTCRFTAEAAAQGANLVLFPEAFIPAYPGAFSVEVSEQHRLAQLLTAGPEEFVAFGDHELFDAFHAQLHSDEMLPYFQQSLESGELLLTAHQKLTLP